MLSADLPSLSVATPTLWVVGRYFKDNPTMISVDSDFETVWGWSICEVSKAWRKLNGAQKLEAAQSQKRVEDRDPSATTPTVVSVDEVDDSR